MRETTEKISGYLQNLEFKTRVFGGIDTDDVIKKFFDLDELYKKAFMENMAEAKGKIATLTEQLQSKQQEVDTLTEENAELKKLTQDRESQRSFMSSDDVLADTFLQLKRQLIAETFADKEKILAEARKDAENIISAAELDKEQIKIKTYLETQNINKEKEKLAEQQKSILELMHRILPDKNADACIEENTPKDLEDDSLNKQVKKA